MNRPQVTTNIGFYSLFAGFLAVFENVKLENIGEAVMSMTFGQLISCIGPIAIGLYAILHNEDK